MYRLHSSARTGLNRPVVGQNRSVVGPSVKLVSGVFKVHSDISVCV